MEWGYCCSARGGDGTVEYIFIPNTQEGVRMKKLLIIGIMLSGVSCFQVYASLEIKELKNGTGFEVDLIPLGENSGMFYDLKNNHAMDAMRIRLEQPDPTKRTIKMEAVDATDKATKEVDFTVYPEDKSWGPLGDLMLSAVNGLFLYRTYTGDSAVKFKTVTNGAALEVTFNATNPRQHIKYIEWCNKFGEAAQELLRELGVRLDFTRFREAPKKPQVTATVAGPGGTLPSASQKEADKALVKEYVNKGYAGGQLRDILDRLQTKYPTDMPMRLDDVRIINKKLQSDAIAQFKEKNAAGKSDDAVRALRSGYYMTKVNELAYKNFKKDPNYDQLMRAINAGLDNYLAYPLGDGRYVVDVIRDFENWLQSQTPPQAPSEVITQPLTSEQKLQQQRDSMQQRRESLQQRMQERANMRQQRQSQSQSVQGR